MKAFTDQSPKRISAEPFRIPAAAPPTILMAAITVFGAMIFTFAPIDLARPALYTQLSILLMYFLKSLKDSHFGVALTFAVLALWIAGSHIYFSKISETAPNINGLASFLPILSFIAFSETRAPISRLLRNLAAISLAYCCIYVLCQNWLIAVNKAGGTGVLAAASGRSERLYLLSSWAAFAFFYGCRVSSTHFMYRSFLIVFSILAIYLSGSRLFQIMFAMYAVLFISGLLGRVVRIATFFLFLFLTLFMLSGLLFPDFNPYSLMEWDQSAAYRMIEYSRSADSIRNHYLLGIGLPLDMDSLILFLRSPRYDLFFISDLGITSMLMMFGLPGLFASVLAVYFCTIYSGHWYRDLEIQALQATCLLMASIAWFSPALFVEPTAMFLGILAAIMLRAKRVRSVQANMAAQPQRRDMAKIPIRASNPAVHDPDV